MLKAKDYRQEAWNKLEGKRGTLALIMLIYFVIMGACGALSYIYIGSIVTLIVSGPFALGITIIGLKVVRRQSVEVEALFGGFKNFGKAFLLNLLLSVLIALWSLLLVIPGIVKQYSYAMSFYILADHPDYDVNQARKLSMQMMKGNKWRLFCLHFSFIGWLLLSVLTLGILMLWIAPYIQSAEAAFYQSLLPEENSAPEPPVLQGE